MGHTTTWSKTRGWSVIAAGAWMATTGPAHAAGPSFSCAKASTPIEHAICADADLSDLDLRLGAAFGSALKRDPAGKAKLLESQRTWLAGRAPTCHPPASGAATREDTACLADLYRARTRELDAIRSQANAPLCQAIADAVRASGGYIKENRWNALVSGLGAAANGPVRFALEGEPMTVKRAATLPNVAKEDVETLGAGQLYRFGPGRSLFAVETVQGTANCQDMRFFQTERGMTKPLDAPAKAEDGGYCWQASIYVGDARDATPLFAVETYAIAHSTLEITPYVDGTWRPSCAVDATYDTALTTTDRFCAPGPPCAGFDDIAMAAARDYDAATSAKPPTTLGTFTPLDPASLKDAPDNEVPSFEHAIASGYTTFENDAPFYAGTGPTGPIVIRVSHGTIGWRVDDGYLVGIYKREGAALTPLAGYVVDKSRTRLKAVSTK